MARVKQPAKKARLMRATKRNRRVPAWVMQRTNRKVVRNPQQRMWRRGHVKP